MGILWWIFGYWLGCCFATSLCSELQKNIVGAAVGGFAANITAIAESVDGTIFAGLITLALNGLANEYPDLKTALNFPTLLFQNSKPVLKIVGCIFHPLHQYSLVQSF